MGSGHETTSNQGIVNAPILCVLTYATEPLGTALVVLWIALGPFTAGVQVQSLVRELRPRKPHSAARKQKQNS